MKVTGRAIYTADMELPAMACGKILRSPYPHARLVKIDATKARVLPGVLAVLTREDLSEFSPYYGAAYKDQPIVALEKVRYAGDPVAAVAAVDECAAEEALALIEVEYEEVPGVMTLEEALAPNAPLVHEEAFEQGELQGFHYRAPDEFRGTNICYRFSFKKGDVSEGFRWADYIFEDTFTLPPVHHYSMEAHSTVAHFDRERITLWTSTQDPFILQNHLEEVFRLPANRIRIIVPYLGGGYGGKLSVKTEPLAVALSGKARRPVKIVHSVEESFKTITRHGARCRIKSGVTRDGRLIARECEIYMNTGAYADAGPRVTQKAGYRAPGPYRIPHIRTEAYTVYTNSVPAGAFRGFGTPQVSWAYESQMDIIAEGLGIDPLEFRLKNLLDKGEDFTPGDRPVDCDLSEGLLRVAEAIEWHLPPEKPNRGKGLSCSMRDGGGAYKLASATVKLNTDGSVVLFTGTVEMGQGAHTALSQIVAEELSVPLDRVVVAQLDTDVTPYDAGTNASSSTVVMGLCVQRAAQDLKRQLLGRAAKKLKCRIEDLTLRDGQIHAGEGPGISFEQILMQWFGS
ncbi:MAG: xanthine dehydrogenase family protein molybdopterin-binding subunit, partial [Candidatus Binatia bacterium]